jgi:hypothetical protein
MSDSSAVGSFGPSVRFVLDKDQGISWVLFRDRAVRDRRCHSRSSSWPSTERRLPDNGELLASAQVRNETRVIVWHDVLCHIRLGAGQLEASLAAHSISDLDRVERELRALIPPVPAETGDRSLLRFWYRARYGAESLQRLVPVPRWDEIRANYPAETSTRLDRLMNWRPEGSGQLVLWYAPPGTGKTFAIRALTRSWREWCDISYIVDPEVFFGSHPDYMLEVLLDEGLADAQDTECERERTPEEAARWRLLIVEDSGELLAADAKERAGQGISRLLNLVDGLIGQGLRVLVLVTGNEPLQSLHPALSRPGRCASITEFLPFEPDEARRWLSARGLDAEPPDGFTLSDLFALPRGVSGAPARRQVGFR